MQYGARKPENSKVDHVHTLRNKAKAQFDGASSMNLPNAFPQFPTASDFEFVDRVHYDLTPSTEKDDFGQDFAVPRTPIETDREPRVAIIGIGYVGHHLVQIFSKCFYVIGYDVSETRVEDMTEHFANNERVRLTTQARELSQATHFLVAVPTLLLPDKSIDSSYLRNALSMVANQARPGSTVVIESSVAVGMTREFLGPLALKNGFYAGMSPERVDPGRIEPPSHAIPKLVSGLDDIAPGSLHVIQKLYCTVFEHVVPVSTPEVAEMTKLYENCQRMVCIAYANEMADACVSHGINPFEVCQAAATKPFGYMPFTPGLGVGGHCIPINPHYLLSNNSFPILQSASEQMAFRPVQIAKRIVARLCNPATPGHRPRILVVGMGFKAGQAHLVNSPGLKLAQSLVLTGQVEVTWVDPLVSQDAIPQIPKLEVEDWTESSIDLRFDLVVVAFKQQGLNFSMLSRLKIADVEMWCS
ncbi:hypothetical protein QQS21_009509 [Conoideocrella luteorostrata]|uniref:Nucleotide sugar dehydrogenase n=1 Tax=Conoideocrella luteorostrata TaxID=1105319 RepID=A0AAJ0CGT5_9HYPO|nr:hypothetical protein QQS21_009509 [Conoideocrella luteorostrata]